MLCKDLESTGNLTFHRYATWDKSETLYFGHDHIITNLQDLSPDEYGEVKAISIDELVEKNNIQKVDIIKIDIEGAEPKTLEGAIKTIKQHRPQLAISVYHQIDHYFDIPYTMITSLDNYRFYYDTYNLDLGESVFYAIPKEMDGNRHGYFMREKPIIMESA